MRTGLEFSENAQSDVDSGSLDTRLAQLLVLLGQRHHVHVTMIRTGHPMGPVSPGGRENDHWYFRAADIDIIDGIPLATDPVAMGTLNVGHLLMGLSGPIRLTRVMGPGLWHEALGAGDRTGFRNEPFANRIHHDHLDLGYALVSQ